MNLITSATSTATPLQQLVMTMAADIITIMLATKLIARARVVLFEEVVVVAAAAADNNSQQQLRQGGRGW